MGLATYVAVTATGASGTNVRDRQHGRRSCPAATRPNGVLRGRRQLDCQRAKCSRYLVPYTTRPSAMLRGRNTADQSLSRLISRRAQRVPDTPLPRQCVQSPQRIELVFDERQPFGHTVVHPCTTRTTPPAASGQGGVGPASHLPARTVRRGTGGLRFPVAVDTAAAHSAAAILNGAPRQSVTRLPERMTPVSECRPVLAPSGTAGGLVRLDPWWLGALGHSRRSSDGKTSHVSCTTPWSG